MDSGEKNSQISTTKPPATPTSHSLAPRHFPPVPGSRPKSEINLFSLPRKIRIQIYRRVLIIPHPVYLFQDAGSRVETFAPDRPFRWLSLLYTNRQIHSEAISVLYGLNSFSLADSTPREVGLLQSFLDSIGPVNAGLLSHLSINFPVAESIEGQPGKVKLRADSLQSLKLLQEKSTNLTTLETFIHGQNAKGILAPDQENSQFIQVALSHIDAQLKAIPSLDKIIVRSFGGTLTPSVIELMQGLGWVVLRSHGK